jgi:hypothetical protein
MPTSNLYHSKAFVETQRDSCSNQQPARKAIDCAMSAPFGRTWLTAFVMTCTMPTNSTTPLAIPLPNASAHMRAADKNHVIGSQLMWYSEGSLAEPTQTRRAVEQTDALPNIRTNRI